MPNLEQARDWYSREDPVHGWDHVQRVYRIAEQLAATTQADWEIVEAAVLLHDAHADPPAGGGKEDSGQVMRRLNHHEASAEFARQVLESEGWQPERIAAVLHCIRAHRFRSGAEQPRTLEAQVLFDADKLDAIGATGVARAIAYAVRRGAPVYACPSRRFQETGQLEPGEVHSAYHEYLFKLVHLKERLYTAEARFLAEKRHRLMVEFFESLKQEAE
jgi:uncharacterized protein